MLDKYKKAIRNLPSFRETKKTSVAPHVQFALLGQKALFHTGKHDESLADARNFYSAIHDLFSNDLSTKNLAVQYFNERLDGIRLEIDISNGKPCAKYVSGNDAALYCLMVLLDIDSGIAGFCPGCMSYFIHKRKGQENCSPSCKSRRHVRALRARVKEESNAQ